MPDQPIASTSYREPKVQDEDDDDIDDLDDVLASFNAPPKPSTGKRPHPTSPPTAPAALPKSATSSSAPAASVSDDADPDGEDFEASLVEGMESLLRQLAGDHPPGVMPDKEDKGKTTAKQTGKDDGADISAEEEEAAWQKAIEMMLSGEGLEALGLEKDGQPKPGAKATQAPSNPAEATQSEEKPDFNETIRRTMEQLKNPSAKSSSANGAGDLEALLAQLGNDPRMAGLGDLDGDDGDLGGLLDGMMAQLMTKEVLEEPMSELASKYPAYLASPPAGVSAADLAKYKQQSVIVNAILETFRRSGYTDEKDGKEVARLVGEMQDLGGPPQEIMGDLPEGFDLGALGGDDGCTIM